MKQERNTAIVLAAGQGKRMHSKIQKQFLEIDHRPVLYYSLECFQKSPLIQEIILVTGEEMISYCKREIVERYHFTKVTKVIAGGKERYDSVYQGLLACEDCDYVFIHDGARPFITEEILERGIFGVQETGACAVGMPSKDTIKIADENGYIASTPKRSLVWQIQTPQVFDAELIVSAYREVIEREQELLSQGVQITDDAMVVEYVCEHPVKLVQGSYENMKLTTPDDLEVAEAFLQKRL